MLNEERIILMTHMASYEEGEGRKNVKIGIISAATMLPSRC